MSASDLVVAALLLAALLFFCAGTLGLLRFTDTLSRMHALTKADNVALGLLAAALAIETGDAVAAMVLLLTWLLVMFSGATTAYLIASQIAHEERGDDR